MDNNRASIVLMDTHEIDITLLSIVKLIPGRTGKIIVKELPDEPEIECCEINCDATANRLVQYIGNNKIFTHQFTCEDHVDYISKLTFPLEERLQ